MLLSDINLQSHCISHELPEDLLEAFRTFFQGVPSSRVPTCPHPLHPPLMSTPENFLLLPAVLPLLTALFLPDHFLSPSSA